MSQWHRDRNDNTKYFGKKRSVVINTADDRVAQLRQAYIDRQLTVDSQRLAEKMIAFEQQIESALSDKNRP